MNKSGSFYIESIVAITMIAIMGTFLLPLFPRLLDVTTELKVRSKLYAVAEYTSNYVLRWAAMSPNTKPVPLNFYQSGDELELSGELRVNRLHWATPLISKDQSITDHYKVSVKFWERAQRANSAVVRILVWYDSNLDMLIDPEEPKITLSTIITEKRDE